MNIKLVGRMFAVIAIMYCGGCNVAGFIANPTAHEKKVPAEYNLRGSDQKIMVYVDEGRATRAGFNFRAQLDEMIGIYLTKRVRPRKDVIVRYAGYLPSRESAIADDQASPAQIGAEAGADMVLYVRIEKFGLKEMDTRGYFNGSLATRSLLIRTSDEQVLWPLDKGGKIVRINVPFEKDGSEKTLNILARSTAHCITRYLYNCPGDEFRSGYEQTEYKLNEM